MNNYPTPKYNVGQYAIVSGNIHGIIEKITLSTGAKEGVLYKINNNYYFEDCIVSILDIPFNANHFYKKLKDITDDAEKAIKALVIRYGEKRAKEPQTAYMEYINGEWVNRNNSSDVVFTFKEDVVFKTRNGEYINIHSLKTETDVDYNPYLLIFDNEDQLYSADNIENGDKNLITLYWRMVEEIVEKEQNKLRK